MKLEIIKNVFGVVEEYSGGTPLGVPCILCKHCARDKETYHYECFQEKKNIFKLSDEMLYTYGDPKHGPWCEWFKYKNLRKL